MRVALYGHIFVWKFCKELDKNLTKGLAADARLRTDRRRFLGAVAKLGKTTISFVMSVCLSLSVCPHGITRLPMGESL
jgi:hypothetical protein